MDVNYLYAVASCEKDEFQNADGEFFKGLFGGVGDKVNEMSDEDKAKATEIGLGILGVVGNWMSNRRDRKQQERGGYYNPTIITQPPPPNNTAIYVISGLAVVGVGVAIYLAIKK